MLFSCSTSSSPMPAALLYLNVAISFLYYYTLNTDTNEGIPSTVGSKGRFGVIVVVPRPLMSNRFVTWFTLTRHGGFVELGSLGRFLIFWHALRFL